MDAVAKVPPGLTPERVGMFTDAIFAIAITLLALELPRPDERQLEHLGTFLGERYGVFIAFGLAFLMLWFTWRAHHTLLDELRRMSQATLALHVPLLLFAAFLPYATGLWGEVTAAHNRTEEANSVALALFGGTEAILMLCQGALYSLALGQSLHAADANLPRMRTYAAVYWGIGVLWALSAVLAFPLSGATTMLWLATPLVASGIALMRRRRRLTAV